MADGMKGCDELPANFFKDKDNFAILVYYYVFHRQRNPVFR